MVIKDLQDYWTLVSAAREGDEGCTACLEMMAYDDDKPGRLAHAYISELNEKKGVAAT
ncbi:MAG: hypothetical protein HRU33_00735 [Rhodobacteraceae bacterium]|nr:hypothetical protein [Paracoccaceae bacterium]